ncbi:MAG TPA: L,D-transpeptidase [Gemmatimonadaceae bacterium]|jgi:hypothetical protein|nr:L,D-transpeptidase [Gemmatimonadaceae bacterium]
MHDLVARTAVSGVVALCLGISTASGQPKSVSDARARPDTVDGGGARVASRADSIDREAARALAERARGFRVVVSLLDRRLWAILGSDTVMTAPVGVASGDSLDYQGRRWSFTTPRGRWIVVAKDSLPVWVPPDWHYYEVARARGLMVRHLVAGEPFVLEDGTQLAVRSGVVGRTGPDTTFTPLPVGDEIIVDGMLVIPPLGTEQRRITGVLGRYRLDLGGGYLLHGTDEAQTVGEAVTHGCVRLHDRDIAWLYEFIPVGTRVYVY